MDDNFDSQKPSVWDAVLFEMTLVLGGILLLVFDMPTLSRWFFGYCILMGVLRIVRFVRFRCRTAQRQAAGDPISEE